MRAVILSIGDELVSGLTVNTNAPWLAQQLTSRGIDIAAHLTVPDSLLHIVQAIRSVTGDDADDNTDLLLISGGLGPTEDDLTRQALADALNEPLVEDPDAVLFLDRWFTRHQRAMSPSNRLQALRPVSAVCIENTLGTAPGLRIEKEDLPAIFVMPGVPREMKEMFRQAILPRIDARLARQDAAASVTLVTKINTFGMGESVLGERIKDLMARAPGQPLPNPRVGTTVHDGIVSIRIYATGAPEQAAALTDIARRQILDRLGPIAFGENDDTLENSLAALLNAGRYTLATAESCTGGLLAKLLTDTPGASGYFARGWVTYANDAKHDELNIPTDLLQQEGAVSEAVVTLMAENARKFARTDFALATTGIAGPDGGTDTKPVGLVWIALASAQGTAARQFIFPGERDSIRLRAAQMALSLLRWRLLGHDPA